jgi:hypothetical protein
MALYAFDGTWNEDEDAPEKDTNVVRFRDAYEGPVEYRTGVGTRCGAIGRLLGGVFGAGGHSRIEEMYDAAKRNWAVGDRVIDIVGFSRGAAMAVHFANVLGEHGLRLPDGRIEKPPIRFLGVWDIVGSFGLNVNFIINFQNIDLGWTIDRVPVTVQKCVHGMALDERRETFNVTHLKPSPAVEEVWFRGVHSDVGGGNENVRRNNISLHWMMQQARAAGLPLSPAQIDHVRAETDRLASIAKNFDPKRDPRRQTQPTDTYHPTAVAAPLQVGGRATFPVRAADLYNWSGVRLQRGASYRVEVVGDQRWIDGGVTADAEGWDSSVLPFFKETIVKRFEDNRRVPTANWFALIAAVDDEDTALFKVGKRGEFTAPEDGDLYAFANDLKGKYGNNQGQITATVERLT